MPVRPELLGDADAFGRGDDLISTAGSQVVDGFQRWVPRIRAVFGLGEPPRLAVGGSQEVWADLGPGRVWVMRDVQE